jgi:DNA mismatch endonuclease (patch repair protein)
LSFFEANWLSIGKRPEFGTVPRHRRGVKDQERFEVADHVAKQKRSAMMAAVRGKHTAPEMMVRKAAHRLGLRFRLHQRDLPGRPDLVLKKWKTAIFVNGCFWHRHAGCARTTTPKSNVAFWKKKFKDNRKRDAQNYLHLSALGWKVLVVWECDVQTVEDAVATLKPHF